MASASDVVIHPTAIVDESARLGEGVRIGPYCVIDADVEIGPRSVLRAHVSVGRWTTLGADCEIWPFASIGSEPQDLKFKGERSELVVGSNNRIREHVTMNRGTDGGGGVTRVGAHNLFMTGAHVGHDSIVGDNTVFANNATLGGHVVVEDYAILGGLSAVHQFCRVGAHSIIGGLTAVVRDLIPFGSAVGSRGNLGGLNLVGLKRRDFSREDIQALRKAYDMLFYGEGILQERLAAVKESFPEVGPVQSVVTFIEADSSRSFCTPSDA